VAVVAQEPLVRTLRGITVKKVTARVRELRQRGITLAEIKLILAHEDISLSLSRIYEMAGKGTGRWSADGAGRRSELTTERTRLEVLRSRATGEEPRDTQRRLGISRTYYYSLLGKIKVRAKSGRPTRGNR
jgi:hypothetical protein